MTKRFLALLLILSMVLGCLTGCEDTPDGPTKSTAATTSPRRRLPPTDGMTMPVSGTLPCLLGICLMKCTTSRTFTVL